MKGVPHPGRFHPGEACGFPSRIVLITIAHTTRGSGVRPRDQRSTSTPRISGRLMRLRSSRRRK